MAIEVRIPTILRTYTGGAKSVEGSGSTLGELLINLDAEHGGLRDRLVDGANLRRFVNVYRTVPFRCVTTRCLTRSATRR